MSILGTLGTIGGTAIGGPLGGAIGGGLGSTLGGLFGGGSSGGGSSSGGMDPNTALYLQQYASAAAAANAPLTAAAQNLAAMTGAYTGALGQRGDLISSGQKTQLALAGNQDQQATDLIGGEAQGLTSRGIRLLGDTADARLQVEQMNPSFVRDAGAAVLSLENDLSKQAAGTNIDMRKAEETGKLNAALDQAYTIGDVFDSRADTKGQMALNSQLLNSNIKMQEVKDLGSLARIQAEGKRQMALRRQGTNMALAGTRSFA